MSIIIVLALFVSAPLARAATVSGFSPAFGPVGTSVSIAGSGFRSAGGVTRVSFGFNNVPSVFAVQHDALITATVPIDATTGPIFVTVGGATAQSQNSFFVAPRIVEFDPTNGAPGTVVTINGANFIAGAGATRVQFNGKDAASVFVVAETQLSATVPSGSSSGPIRVTTGAGTGVSSNNFVITGTEPRITEFTPKNGVPGNQIVIRGSFFQNVTSVTFGGVAASEFAVVSTTQINATVPGGAKSGRISITSFSGTGQSAEDFTVTAAPIITEFSPERGAPGTTVTINGSNFVPGATTVKFKDTAAQSVSVVSPTQLHAVVPQNAITGPIRVTTGAGTGVSATEFVVTLLPVITRFNPDSGPPGTPVTIDGENFLGATAVGFSGTNAASFNVVSSTQIRATVQPGASTGPISITTGAGTSQSAGSFVVIPVNPVITEFTPRAGLPGQEVIIEGRNFTGAFGVEFGGAPAAFGVTADTQIHATVPANALSGPIRIKTGYGAGDSTNNFVAAPRLDSFSPTGGVAGVTVVIRGTNLTEISAVKFGGVVGVVTEMSLFEAKVTLPPDARTGAITITTPAGIVSSTNAFGVLPTIASISPLGGPAGTVVKVLGTGFGDATSVKFNGVTAAFTIVSAQEISTTVPLGGVTGRITVATPTGQATSAQTFTVAIAADLGLASKDGPDPALLGDTLTYTITVTNRGPNTAQGVLLTNLLSTAVTYVSSSVSRGTISRNGATVVATLGDMQSGTGATATIVVRAAAPGTIPFESTVGSRVTDPGLSDNKVVESTVVVKGVGIRRVPAGITLFWPAALTNVTLQTRDTLDPLVQWANFTGAIQTVGAERVVNLPIDQPMRFFRLIRPSP